MSELSTVRIGVDFGGVIVSNVHRQGTEDTSLLPGDAGQTAQPGVIDAMHWLVGKTESQVWIVSKAGPQMQERTRQWLDRVSFYSRTGLPKENVRFCLERGGEAADL